MSSGATIAAYLSIGPKVYGQQNLTGCGEFFFTNIRGWSLLTC